MGYSREAADLTKVIDLGHIMKNLREQDMEEAWLLSGGTPWLALLDSVTNSDEAWIEYVDGVPFAVFGVGRDADGNGSPWMVATTVLPKHSKHLMAEARRLIAEWRPKYRLFGNLVLQRNRTSIRWLKRLGFIVNQPIAVGPFKAPFRPFYME